MATANTNRFNFTDKSLDRFFRERDGNCYCRDLKTPGLYCYRINGRESWYFVKKVHGKSYNRKIAYRALMPLPEAKRELAKLFVAISSGNDPLATKRDTACHSLTVEQALTAMLDVGTHRESTKKSYRLAIAPRGTFHSVKDEPLARITPAMVGELHTAKSQTHEAQANKDCRTLSAVWTWSRNNYGLEGDSPTTALNASHRTSGGATWNRTKRRKTLVQRHQLAAWFASIQALQHSQDISLAREAAALEIMMLTGLRKNEVLCARWDWIDWSGLTLTIPGERAKNHQELTRPLTSRVAEILRNQEVNDQTLIFPNAIDHSLPLKDCLPTLAALKNETDISCTHNDMRRTFASAATAAGINQQIVKALLNHLSDSEVTAGYQSHSLDTLRTASQETEDWLLTEAGLLDRSIDKQLAELVGKLSDPEKRALIFELSARNAGEQANG
jgi:integrase